MRQLVMALISDRYCSRSIVAVSAAAKACVAQYAFPIVVTVSALPAPLPVPVRTARAVGSSSLSAERTGEPTTCAGARTSGSGSNFRFDAKMGGPAFLKGFCRGGGCLRIRTADRAEPTRSADHLPFQSRRLHCRGRRGRLDGRNAYVRMAASIGC